MKQRFSAREDYGGNSHHLARLRKDFVEKIRREVLSRCVIQSLFIPQTITAMQVANVC
jgi:hypothetical protein